MTKDEIVKEIRRRTKLFGAQFILSRKRQVEFEPGLKCSGFFTSVGDSGEPELVVSRCYNDDQFLGVLLHEYCHLTQWAENCVAWQNDDYWSSIVDVGKWIGTNKPCTPQVKAALDATRDLEADNERRTVRLIKELGAPVDLEDYIQKANSYIHFYNTISITNRWYDPDRVPYKTPEVTDLFRSDKIDDNFVKTPKRQLKALLTCADTRS